MNGVESVLERLAERDTSSPGDYTENGILMCGICHTPKQTTVDFQTGPRLVPVVCKCQQEANEVSDRQAKRERFRQDMERRREDGISCPDGLRYTFVQDDRKELKVSDACRRYVEHWEKMRAENIGILFHGAVGTGKSFYASCIGNGLLEKLVPVAATNFPRLLNQLQGSQEKQKLLDRLTVYKLLILDDLGVERDSTYGAEQIFNIIDARVRSNLPVVVTTNLTLEEMEHPPSMQYARIYDRVLGMCPVRIKMIGASRRRGNAEIRKQLAQRILLGGE